MFWAKGGGYDDIVGQGKLNYDGEMATRKRRKLKGHGSLRELGRTKGLSVSQRSFNAVTTVRIAYIVWGNGHLKGRGIGGSAVTFDRSPSRAPLCARKLIIRELHDYEITGERCNGQDRISRWPTTKVKVVERE